MNFNVFAEIFVEKCAFHHFQRAVFVAELIDDIGLQGGIRSTRGWIEPVENYSRFGIIVLEAHNQFGENLRSWCLLHAKPPIAWNIGHSRFQIIDSTLVIVVLERTKRFHQRYNLPSKTTTEEYTRYNRAFAAQCAINIEKVGQFEMERSHSP